MGRTSTTSPIRKTKIRSLRTSSKSWRSAFTRAMSASQWETLLKSSNGLTCYSKSFLNKATWKRKEAIQSACCATDTPLTLLSPSQVSSTSSVCLCTRHWSISCPTWMKTLSNLNLTWILGKTTKKQRMTRKYMKRRLSQLPKTQFKKDHNDEPYCNIFGLL